MLHLFAIRAVLIGVIVVIGIGTLAAFYSGFLGSDDYVRDVIRIIQYASPTALFLIFVPGLIWRFSRWFQTLIFPYLGGEWIGEVKFEFEGSKESRPVQCFISHNLFGISMVLESEEASSCTLVAHAVRRSEYRKNILYYAYLNERKEGFNGGSESYQGFATIRSDFSENGMLNGKYFTEWKRSGTIHLSRRCTNPFYKPWI